jgi:predicted cupin superfamily sugar epimerase
MTMNNEAKYWIEKLGLSEHQEGGYYKVTYRSDKEIPYDSSVNSFLKTHVIEKGVNSHSESDDYRPISSAIYYLLDGAQFSCFHTQKFDELWHFYSGSSLSIHIINGNGEYSVMKLGRNFENGELFQVLIKGEVWFGANVDDPTSYTLVGCTVSPGFDYRDYEIGERQKLNKVYPQYKSIINKLTKG